ncbi:hypothetical protein RHSIM_Rhsim06G0175600 [Rhododendron simsii]|uniref:BTB domain-containing protein n=1 Tax=Rhododendron simsii TaxID=118357 RepID=A0A834GX98_RHOSS|nr:hypothetical protein RHSIM_Rhsim06G0175600 [Rhododendron simsii]
MSQRLLAAADRYGLERLRLLCEANLCDNVVINTVATTLALTEGFEYLKESCPSGLTELLQYIARINKHSAIGSSYGNVAFLDGMQRPQQ